MNWKKVNTNSLQLYNAIQPIVRNTWMINCDENWILDNDIQHIQLDDSHYYGAQFNTAIRHIPDNKLFCIVVGDNIPDNDFLKIFSKALHAFNTHKIGIYAPYDKRSVHQKIVGKYHDMIHHVQNTDCGFWFIHPNIYMRMQSIDYTVSKYGWGIDIIVIKEAKKYGMLVVSDHSISTDQIDHTCGYDIAEAAKESAKLQRIYYQQNKNKMLPFMRTRNR